MITGRRWKRSHGGGVMFPRNSVRGNQFGSVTVAGRSTGRMRRCAQRCALTALTFDPDLAALVSIDSTSVRTHQHAAGARASHPDHTGAVWNYTNMADEPADHALGRSRDGFTTGSTLSASSEN
jgi:hypothetical protein